MISREEFASRIDHAAIGTAITREQVERFIQEAIAYHFAAVYVNPCDVAFAKARLAGTGVLVGAGAGANQGVNTVDCKIAEALEAIEDGADCVELYMNVSRLLDGDEAYVRDEVNRFVKAVKAKKRDAVVKVIIECPYLNREQKVKACEIVAQSGAEYVKESSGSAQNANFSLADIRLMKSVVGERCKIKAAGDVNTLENAVGAMEFGADLVGNDRGPQWMEEFDQCMW